MTPEDIDFIRGIGNWMLLNIAVVIVHTVLYGIFFLPFCVTMVLLIRKGLTTRAQWMMLIINITCFTLFTLYLIIHAMRLIIFVKYMLIDNIALPEDENGRLFDIKMQKLDIISNVVGELLPIISDMVVVWRAWAIFPSHRRWIIGPIFLLLCTIVITILHLLSLNDCIPAFINNVLLVNGLLNAASAASIATNLAATLLIFYNLWDHRKIVSVNINIGHQRPQSQGVKVLAILVESGATYCAFQVLTLTLGITYAVNDSLTFTYGIFTVVYSGASAMYSVIVVLLVRLQPSFEHTYGFSLVTQVQEHEHRNTSHLPTIGRLQFASTPSNVIMSGENGEILGEGQEK